MQAAYLLALAAQAASGVLQREEGGQMAHSAYAASPANADCSGGVGK